MSKLMRYGTGVYEVKKDGTRGNKISVSKTNEDAQEDLERREGMARDHKKDVKEAKAEAKAVAAEEAEVIRKEEAAAKKMKGHAGHKS